MSSEVTLESAGSSPTRSERAVHCVQGPHGRHLHPRRLGYKVMALVSQSPLHTPRHCRERCDRQGLLAICTQTCSSAPHSLPSLPNIENGMVGKAPLGLCRQGHRLNIRSCAGEGNTGS